MSRKLVYLNGQNESLTFETGPYLIVKIEGLGIPNVDRQEQKSPYQDGTTYIDSLLQNRDIVVELAITKPNDFANIALYRRELSQRLTPKYGLGDLNYTDEDGNEYTIRAVVSSMVFTNKDYRDPYMRAMVTFTACDPYWRNTTIASIALPTSVLSSPSLVSAGGTETLDYPSLVLALNETYYLFYIKFGTGTMLTTSTDFITWSVPVNISAQYWYFLTVIQLADGTFRATYSAPSTGYLTTCTSSDGITWNAAVTIDANAGDTSSSMIQQSDGTFRVAWQGSTELYQSTSTTGATWSARTLIETGGGAPSLIQEPDGSFMVAYSKSSAMNKKRSVDGITWAASTIVSSTNSWYPFLFKNANNSYMIFYRRVSDDYLVSRYSIDGETWGSESVMVNITVLRLTIALTPLGNYSVIYANVPAPTNQSLYSVTRTVTPVPAVNTGDVPAPFLVTFQGPSTNPRIINQNTLEYIRLNTTLAAADSFEVDTSFGNKTVKLIQGGIVKNGIAFLDIGSTFFQLERGSNTVYYEDDAVLSTATASLEFTERYSGL